MQLSLLLTKRAFDFSVIFQLFCNLIIPVCSDRYLVYKKKKVYGYSERESFFFVRIEAFINTIALLSRTITTFYFQTIIQQSITLRACCS